MTAGHTNAAKADIVDVFLGSFAYHLTQPLGAGADFRAYCAAHHVGAPAATVGAPRRRADLVDRMRDTLAAGPDGMGWPADDALARRIAGALDFAEMVCRALYGGTRPRVRKNPLPAVRTARILAAMNAGLPVEEAFAAAGVTRSTGYRLLRQRAR